MRAQSISYAKALSLARESRPIISPNTGFARQLKIWEECAYEIFVPGTSEEKAPYSVWKGERDELWKGGEEAIMRARVLAMGSMAAGFGRMRLTNQDNVDEVTEVGDEGEGDVVGNSKENE
jgi:hypothetical protein